ncbi:MAG: threonine/serine exporter family protein [Chloroflexota bacterium]|jgi:uncharacterized membrane protein YjjB (DUF3815 family)|nr:threonine/serine exporter family protein [Anaerolineae bacterium]HMM30086.1 threonine/serine exporter family protein [Aggregatilineaceae bacterium]
MQFADVLQQGFWAFVATAGFAVLFNVPTRMLAVCGLTGALGLMWRAALLDAGAHAVAATFAGALIVGVLGYTQARFFHMPRLIFTVNGIVPMIPGVAAFETMVFFVRGDIDAGVESAVVAFLLIGAIAFGLVTARMLMTLGDTRVPGPPRGIWLREHARGDLDPGGS